MFGVNIKDSGGCLTNFGNGIDAQPFYPKMIAHRSLRGSKNRTNALVFERDPMSLEISLFGMFVRESTGSFNELVTFKRFGMAQKSCLRDDSKSVNKSAFR